MSDEVTADVAVLGLGRMGAALARALLASGRRVAVWNRDPSKAQSVPGAIAFPTVAEAIAASSLLVVCLTRYATWEILLSGLGPEALTGKTVVQLSSGAADEAADLAQKQRTLGASCLDGAILAYPRAIGTPEAGITISGDEPAWLRYAATLQVLGSVEYIGPDVAHANAWDSAALVLLYGSVTSALQAGAMLSAAGVPLTGAGERLESTSRAVPHLVGAASTAMAERAYPGTESALHTFEDLFAQMREFLERSGAETAYIRGIETIIQKGIALGHRDDYFTSIFEAFRPR